MDLLIEHRAQLEPGGRILSRNGFGETLLMTAACEYGFLKQSQWPPQQWLLACMPKQLAREVNYVDENGYSALHQAAIHRNGPIVRLLLAHPQLRINEMAHNPFFPTNVKQLLRLTFRTSNKPLKQSLTPAELTKYDHFKDCKEDRSEKVGSLSAEELAFNKALIAELEAHPNFSQEVHHIGAEPESAAQVLSLFGCLDSGTKQLAPKKKPAAARKAKVTRKGASKSSKQNISARPKRSAKKPTAKRAMIAVKSKK